MVRFGSFGTESNSIDIAPKHSGSIYGIINSFGAMSGFVGVYLAGHILESTGSWSVLFSVTALINMVGIIIFAIFGSGEPIV